MSYALETKKRKFERILESLTDNTTQARGSPNTRNDLTGRLPGSTTIDLSKRRRITPVSNAQIPPNGSTASLVAHYLPSSRLAFLERLESFRQVTKWHISSTSSINAVEWAKRGWVCQNTDTVSCMQCKERLHIDIDVETAGEDEDSRLDENNPLEEESDSLKMKDAVSQALIKRYQDMIITAHTNACSWRRRGCDASIQRIEGLLNMPAALAGLEERYQSIAKDNMEVPLVAAFPSIESPPLQTSDTERYQLSDQEMAPNGDTLRLAICGWQRKETDILECRHCFRSLGLWLYRGTNPTMENLDAIDSHLEYCPWRSDIAQDTEIPSHNDQGELTKEKLPGWTLVCLAIAKSNGKANGSRRRDANRQAHDVDEDVQPQLSPEQREKKMKDLMKRIKDLKKPFNVKSLLKRKEKTPV